MREDILQATILPTMNYLPNARHFPMLALVLFSVHSVLGETSRPPSVTIQSAPEEPIIELRDESQFLNFELIVRNMSQLTLRLSEIQLAVYDAKDSLVMLKSLNTDAFAPSIAVIGKESPPTTRRSVTAPANPAQLPLHRLGISGLRRRIARSAICLRAFRGLWGFHCGYTRVNFAAIAAGCGWRCNRMDLQSLGNSRSPECFLPGESRRAVGGAVGSHVFHSHCACADTADHARTRVPDSSST